jgi:hypothetical protein
MMHGLPAARSLRPERTVRPGCPRSSTFLTPRRLLLLAAALALVGALAQPSQAASFRCAGAPADYPHKRYPEKRVFLESQAWWTKGTASPESTAAHHAHLGVCFPQGVVARFPFGRIRWDFRIILHNMRSYRATQLVGAWAQRKVGRTCWKHRCQWYVTVYGSTGHPAFPPTDGRKELRPKIKIKTPDGFEMFQSDGWQIIIRRGRQIVNYRPTNAAIGRGWYTGFNYANVSMSSYRAPGPRVRGIWWPKVRAQTGASGLPVNAHLFTIDPDFHKRPVDRGIVVTQGTGEFRGRLRIDTRRLRNGMHKLVMIAHARHIDGLAPDGTNSGVEVLPFWVRN